ncbi:MAG: hypothetical protein ACKO23_00390 [Gemmataceae bacterium]
MSLLTLIILVPFWVAEQKPSDQDVDRGARVVLAAMVAKAESMIPDNTYQGGDVRLDQLIRSGAQAAGTLPESVRVPAFLLGMGAALDTSNLLRENPVLGPRWKGLETPEQRKRRLKALGKPTLHGREDLGQHFAVSAALTVLQGEKRAEAADILKEVLDSAPGGSGFSFADLAADLSGIALAQLLTTLPDHLQSLAKSFAASDYCLSPRGLEEGLSQDEFQKRHGSVRDRRFQQALDGLRERIRDLPAYRDSSKAR